MPKLYTKIGDYGTTNLYDMTKLPKYDITFSALGDLDELSAYIGFLCSEWEVNRENKSDKSDRNISDYLRKIQVKLLDIGSDLATIKNRKNIKVILDSDVTEIEHQIDKLELKDVKLTEFILPGFKTLDSIAHICRTVCRRAERNMWKLKNKFNLKKTAESFLSLFSISENEPLNFHTGIESFKYVNRLSDYFFALSRHLSNGKEITRSYGQNL